MIEKYKPSNGSEGCSFESEFCDRCHKDLFDEKKGVYIRQCDIHDRAILLEEDDPKYPDEWRICPATREAVCTAFTETREPVPIHVEPEIPGQLKFA